MPQQAGVLVRLLLIVGELEDIFPSAYSLFRKVLGLPPGGEGQAKKDA